jgi:probable rRNA maturation factor
MARIVVEVSDNQSALAVDADRLKRASAAILADAGVVSAQLSIAVVDDPTIHELNRRYLDHDDPTDVLSFLLERDGNRLEGEIVVSADTAKRAAQRFGWPGNDELLLYVIHGTLHLVGFDDTTAEARATMRAAEHRWLAEFGLTPPADPQDNASAAADALPEPSGPG